jgi:hypothetical protein
MHSNLKSALERKESMPEKDELAKLWRSYCNDDA